MAQLGQMGLLIIIAQICGTATNQNLTVNTDIKNCYKQLLVCVEHKQNASSMSETKALKSCILEM